ncbi:DUF4190 domain-containing protein [Paenibacillus sp. YPG26]|uniref:DUF4190 domain-containing protein n=1 Tax=Paenibacillus sp. YPG26 TaxID=2878915 RepID=UPI0020420940|nr:DUF4190 domain-containing protein [Paenibacillus sp. YPG26]USB34864.1 DUF4190 domain-containing protein [Paenibacillus sp. YPG26]
MYQESQDPFAYERYHQRPPVRTNTKSIVSLVLGICSISVPYLGFVIGIVAIIFACLSFRELKYSGERGRGLSVAGLVCGIVGTVFYAGAIVLIVLSMLYMSNYGAYVW